MGRKSTRENKNMYQQCREAMGYTREEAAEKLVFISSDRIEKIESGRSEPHPDEVLEMSRCYKKPELCFDYCSGECPIGKAIYPELDEKSLAQITLEMLDALEYLHDERKTLVAISLDGRVRPDEIKDFKGIHKKLTQMYETLGAYRMWLEGEILNGQIDGEALNK